MLGRLVYESFRRQKRRKLLAGVAVTLGVAVATAAGTRAGYVYLHSAVDGYSRLAYTEALVDEKAIGNRIHAPRPGLFRCARDRPHPTNRHR